jgi:hypothetical protein
VFLFTLRIADLLLRPSPVEATQVSHQPAAVSSARRHLSLRNPAACSGQLPRQPLPRRRLAACSASPPPPHNRNSNKERRPADCLDQQQPSRRGPREDCSATQQLRNQHRPADCSGRLPHPNNQHKLAACSGQQQQQPHSQPRREACSAPLQPSLSNRPARAGSLATRPPLAACSAQSRRQPPRAVGSCTRFSFPVV